VFRVDDCQKQKCLELFTVDVVTSLPVFIVSVSVNDCTNQPSREEKANNRQTAHKFKQVLSDDCHQ